jgi:hypothetical protein
VSATQIDLSDAKIVEALSSRHWRMQNLYKITDKWGKEILFTPNEAQQELEDQLWWANIILKSRQHGITTWACLRALDSCLFTNNFRAGIIAHKSKDAEKFFRHKILFAYDRLPDWIKARRPTMRRDLNAGVLELNNGSSVEVSTSHRGGTLNFLHVSEYGPMCAFYPLNAKEVASGALNTIKTGPSPTVGEHGNIIIIESTAHGASGDFHARCTQAQDFNRTVKRGEASLTEMDYRFTFFAWFQDPSNKIDPEGVPVTEAMERYFESIEEEMDTILTRAQRAWYIKKSVEQKENMRREHPSTPKEAFDAAIDGAYYGKQMGLAEAEGRVGLFPFRPDAAVHTFWDIGRRDATAIWFMQQNGPWYEFIRYWETWGEQSIAAVRELKRLMVEEKYVYGKHYMPHDVEVTEWVGQGDNKPRKTRLEEDGITPIIVVPQIDNELEGIDLTRGMLYRCRFDELRCGPPEAGGKLRGGLEALRQFRKEWNDKTEQFSATPKKDWTNHGADAFRQFGQAFSPDKPKPRAKGQSLKGEDSWKTL